MTAKRNERGKRPQIQATVDPALFERIKAEAAAAFDSVSAIVEARLNASYATGEPQKTPFAATKEASAEADLTLKQIRIQQIRKELLPVELAVKTVEDFLGGLRVNGLDFVDEIARDFGLDAKELRRRFLAKMAGDFEVTGERRERLQELANDFSKEPLP